MLSRNGGKNDMSQRERNNKLTIYLNDAELNYLKQRCRETNENMSQIIRELIVFGFNYYVDYDSLKAVSHELNAIGRNINQVVARVNATGNIYKDDIDDIKKEMDEIWRSLRSTLSGQMFKRQ